MTERKEIDLSELGKLVVEGPAGLEKLKKQAEAITTLQETLMLMVKQVRPYEVPTATDKNVLKFGLYGDTQIGSLYQRMDALKVFYERCADEGVTKMCMAGDLVDGWRVYRGQEFELRPDGIGWPRQREIFVNEMPYFPDMDTYFITGNHDSSFKSLVGLVVGDEIQAIRPDWKFIGADTGQVDFTTESGHKFKVMMIHPGGGINQYALSYKPQRIIESLSGGQKPDLIGIGHYHKAFFIPAYRNMVGICVGCFQSQTPFMARQSIAAHVGGWIITVTLGDREKLTTRVQAEFVGFYEEQK